MKLNEQSILLQDYSRRVAAALDLRAELLSSAASDPYFQREIYNRCCESNTFFINGFIWVFNPRSQVKTLPFILHPVQEELAEAIDNEIITGKSSLSEKSRDTGITYLHLATYLRHWLFNDGCEFLLGSMKQLDVDDWTTSSLFGKLRFMLYRLPKWLTPYDYNRKKCDHYMSLTNPDNGNKITGRATTEDFGRSGRKTAVLVDEHASVTPRIIQGIERSLPETTNCVQRISTPKGIGIFKQIRDKKRCAVHTIHWTQFPEKSEGLYYLDDSGKRVECPNLAMNRRSPYGYYIDPFGAVTTYRLRSSWYDKKRDEYLTERDIAQELDINYQGSGGCRFDGAMLDLGSKLCKDGKRGYLLDRGEPGKPRIEFIEVTDPSQPFDIEVWEFPDRENKWNNKYFGGADVAEGLEKGDYSGCDIISKSNDGLSEFHAACLHGHWQPDVFADKLWLLGMWYGGCKLAVERNKDGLGVLLRLQNHHRYSNLYTEKTQGSINGEEATDRLGFLTSSGAKKFLITGDLDNALKTNELTSLSIAHYTEFSTYENNNGVLGATGTNHDDRVIMLSICHHVSRQGGRPQMIKPSLDAQLGTFKFKPRLSTNGY